MSMNNLLSGFVGAIIGALLTIGYLHFSEKVKRRIDATIELIDYIDELYHHLMAMSFLPIDQPEQVALLSPDEYRATVNKVIILLTSTKPQTRLDMLFRNKNIIDEFEQLRKAFKEALDSCHDKDNFSNLLNTKIDPLYKKLHSRLISSTRLLNAIFS